jgi:branched-chain amino acid transport system substrate-binding protein
LVRANSHLTLIGTTAALLAGLLELAQAGPESCPAKCPSGKVQLGITAPMSGAQAAFGRQTVKAAEIAVSELNAGGGLLGFPIELVVADDRCDVGSVVRAATHQVEEQGIRFVIGPTCPPPAIAAAPIYAKADVMQFMPTMSAVGITWRNPDNFFRIAETDEQSTQALSAHLAGEYRGKKVAIVYTDTFYMRPLIEMLRAALAPGMQISSRFEPLLDVPGATERLANKLQRDPPDLIYMALDPDLIMQLVPSLRNVGLKANLMGGQRLLTYRLWKSATMEGVQIIAPLSSLDDPEYRKATSLLIQAEVIPDLIALNSYASVQTWAEAVRRAGSGDHGKVVEALQSGEFGTAVGPIAFDLQGDRRNIHSTIVKWDSGRLRELGAVR